MSIQEIYTTEIDTQISNIHTDIDDLGTYLVGNKLLVQLTGESFTFLILQWHALLYFKGVRIMIFFKKATIIHN